VWVLEYQYKYGTELTAHATEDQAQAEAARIARANWADVAPSCDDMPATPDGLGGPEVTRIYFDRARHDEYYIHVLDVEGAPAEPGLAGEIGGDHWACTVGQDDSDESISALVAHATRLGIEPEDLDDLVHDLADQPASHINNRGLDAQIPYLVAGMGVAQARAYLDGLRPAAPEAAGHAPVAGSTATTPRRVPA
jgi:hypothetical protein